MKKTTTSTFAHFLLWLVCATLPLGFIACSDDEAPHHRTERRTGAGT